MMMRPFCRFRRRRCARFFLLLKEELNKEIPNPKIKSKTLNIIVKKNGRSGNSSL